MLTGRERYRRAVQKAYEAHRGLYSQFMAGEIESLPDGGDAEREAVIAEM